MVRQGIEPPTRGFSVINQTLNQIKGEGVNIARAVYVTQVLPLVTVKAGAQAGDGMSKL